MARIDGPTGRGLAGQISYGELGTQIKVLLEAIDSELCYRRFSFVPDAKAKILDNIERDWKVVWDQVGDARSDSEAAVKCYALEQNDACVFHLMRASEHGLRIIARKMKVRLTHKGRNHPIDFADWNKVLDGVKLALDKAHKLPHGAKRAAQLQFYSDAGGHCLYMRELRNTISHARKSYNDGEALGAMERVRAFMIFVAHGLAAKGRLVIGRVIPG